MSRTRLGSDPTAVGEMNEKILREIDSAGGALFVTELAARLGTDSRSPECDAALDALEVRGEIVVRDHIPPDVHLEGVDLRIVASSDARSPVAASEAVRSVWDQWLRSFLATHRCG